MRHKIYTYCMASKGTVKLLSQGRGAFGSFRPISSNLGCMMFIAIRPTVT
jgi:hypothetical protein